MVMRSAFALCATLVLPAASVCARDAAQPPVSLAIVGDVMLAGSPGKEIARGHDPLGPFANVLALADVRVANLELGYDEFFPRSFEADTDKPGVA